MAPPAVTSSTTVNVVPSMVRLFVQVTGADLDVLVAAAQRQGRGRTAVATASPAVTPASARAARPSLRPRRSTRALVLVDMKDLHESAVGSGDSTHGSAPIRRIPRGSLSQAMRPAPPSLAAAECLQDAGEHLVLGPAAVDAARADRRGRAARGAAPPRPRRAPAGGRSRPGRRRRDPAEEPPPGLVGGEVEVDGGVEPVVGVHRGRRRPARPCAGSRRGGIPARAPPASSRACSTTREHDVVGHQLPLLHVGPGEAAELGVHLDVPAQGRAGREVGEAEVAGQAGALRALPRSGSTDDDEVARSRHGRPASTAVAADRAPSPSVDVVHRGGEAVGGDGLDGVGRDLDRDVEQLALGAWGSVAGRGPRPAPCSAACRRRCGPAGSPASSGAG